MERNNKDKRRGCWGGEQKPHAYNKKLKPCFFKRNEIYTLLTNLIKEKDIKNIVYLRKYTK